MKKILHTLKTPAALIILLIFSVSVNSQTVISSVSADQNAKILSKHLTHQSRMISLDLNSENWMSNKNYLELSSRLTLKEIFTIYETVSEKEIILENWMMDDNNWKLVDKSLINETLELDKELEEWMFDDNFWDIKNDKEMHPMESWMTDNKFWVTVD